MLAILEAVEATCMTAGASQLRKVLEVDFGAMAWASYQGHLRVVRYFFSQGVRLNPGSQLDRSRGNAITQLMFAAWGGQAEVVRFLLANGADMFIRQARWFMDEEGQHLEGVWCDDALTPGHYLTAMTR